MNVTYASMVWWRNIYHIVLISAAREKIILNRFKPDQKVRIEYLTKLIKI